MNLKDTVIGALKTKPPVQKWFIVTFRDGNTGAFTSAVILQSDNPVDAAMKAYKMRKGGELSERSEIPEERVPQPEYCNRALTADDLKTIWPDFFKGDR